MCKMKHCISVCVCRIDNYSDYIYKLNLKFRNIEIFFAYSEQCHNLISGIYKTSCKTGEGVEEMFADIAAKLSETNR